jgi:hypothetical protein
LGNCSLSPSLNRNADGDLGVIVKIEFKCPKTKRIIPVEFEIITVQDVYTMNKEIQCDCGTLHGCTPSGRMY